jgi:hypothetical protein
MNLQMVLRNYEIRLVNGKETPFSIKGGNPNNNLG